jgi:hypothetical protein
VEGHQVARLQCPADDGEGRAVGLDVGQLCRLPSGNQRASCVMKVRGISQGPRCEPATNSSVECRRTGSTGIQKLTFCRPSTL